MTRQETETLSRLSQKVSDMAKQLDQNTRDTQAIRSSLDNLTGGKQAFLWLAGFIVSVAVAIATWIGVGHK